MNLVRDRLHLLSTMYLLYKKSSSLKNEMKGPREKKMFTTCCRLSKFENSNFSKLSRNRFVVE